MSRRYLVLSLGVFLAALLSVLGTRLARRGDGGDGHPRTAAAPRTPAHVVEIALDIRGDSVAASRRDVTVGDIVALQITNHRAGTAKLALAGYEDRLPAIALSPGATWAGRFLADRPGDDIAWLLDGAPAGRLGVRGPHLAVGRR